MPENETRSPAAPLLPHQKIAASRLKGLVANYLKIYVDGPDKAHAPLPDMENRQLDEARYGSFGLFGQRGSGKTTVLRSTLDTLADEHPELLVCKHPLDCTTLARRLPLGLSLTRHVHAYLKDEAVRKDLCPGLKREQEARVQHARAQGAERALEEAWTKVLDHYVATDGRHQQLQLALAVTPSEYQDMARDEMQSRAQLSKSIEKWVDAALDWFNSWCPIEKKKNAILVALEDADLGTGPVSGRVVATFLDELSYQRILFIIVADERNLEERFRIDRDREFSPEIVPAVLAKVTPVHHRVYLDPWSPEERKGFLPWSRVHGHEDIPLGELLRKALEASLCPDEATREHAPAGKAPARSEKRFHDFQVRDLIPLLPRHPRGLADLHRGLSEALRLVEQVEGSFRDEEIVLLLARSRGDMGLARALTARRLAWWGRHLLWPQEPKSSQKKPKGTQNKLEGSQRWRQLLDQVQSDRPIWTLEEATLPAELPRAEVSPLWKEFLLNLSFRGDPASVRYFVNRFELVRAQISECAFEFQPTIVELLGIKHLGPGILDSPWLSWEGEMRHDARIRVGWAPLLDWSFDRRSSVVRTIFRDLGAPLPLAEARPQAEPLLPADLRSLLLLTDRISGLPWVSLKGAAEAPFLTDWFATLSLACGEAYLGTLDDCLRMEVGSTPEEGITRKLETLCEDARTRRNEAMEPGSVRQGPAILRDFLARLDRELPWAEIDHPMVPACQAFFRSDAVAGIAAPAAPAAPAAAAAKSAAGRRR